jgi:RNA polymerase sigma-70 factor (ECF subfamily)
VFAYVYGRVRDARETEDLASDIFSKAFAGLDALADERLFEVRLFTIAHDLLISRTRAQSLREPRPEDELLQQPDMARLLERVRRLDPREQDIIALKFDAELTNAQIALVLGEAEDKVRVILYRTLRKLRRALERDD